MTKEIQSTNSEVNLRTPNDELPTITKQTQFSRDSNEHKLLFDKLL